MLISKEAFIGYVNDYKRAFEEQDKFQDALRPFFDFPVCTYQSSLIEAFERLLVEVSECQDEDGIFSWWALESPNDSKVIEVKDLTSGKVITYNVQTVEGLYKYLYDIYHNTGKNK